MSYVSVPVRAAHIHRMLRTIDAARQALRAGRQSQVSASVLANLEEMDAAERMEATAATMQSVLVLGATLACALFALSAFQVGPAIRPSLRPFATQLSRQAAQTLRSALRKMTNILDNITAGEEVVRETALPTLIDAVEAAWAGEQAGAAAENSASTDEPQGAAAHATEIGVDDFQAVAAVNTEWVDAFHRRDAHAVSMLYTADAVVVTQERPPVKGRQAIEELYQFYFASGLTGFAVHTQEMYRVGDMISELGRSEAVTDGGGGLRSHRYMTLWKKDEGTWRAHRDYICQ